MQQELTLSKLELLLLQACDILCGKIKASEYKNLCSKKLSYDE